MLVALVFVGFVVGAVVIMRWQGRVRAPFMKSWAVWTGYAAAGLILLFAARQMLSWPAAIGSVIVAPIPAAILSLRSLRATFPKKPKEPAS